MRSVVKERDPREDASAWRRVAPVIALVAADLIPLAGVIWLGWDLFSILVLYWLESGVVGVVNIFRIRRAAGVEGPGATVRFKVAGRPAGATPRGCLAAFFTIHYGIFWVVHGVFVLLLPLLAGIVPTLSGRAAAGWTTSLTVEGIAIGLLALVAFHVLEYWYRFVGKGEYLRTTPAAQMFAPYVRVIVLHFTILVGAFAVIAFGQPVLLVALMVGLKTAIDLALYALGRARAATAAA